MRGGSGSRALRRGIAIVPVALALALWCSAAALGARLGDGSSSGEFAVPLPASLGMVDPQGQSGASRLSRAPKSALAGTLRHREHRRGGPGGGRTRPSPATVLSVRRLFHVLGYPLGRERGGKLGVRIKGALSYFQRKYGLPITGYPDARTVAQMQAVAASLSAAPASGRPAPKDLVDRLLGGVPIMGLALACALGLALLALAASRRDLLSDR